MPAKSEAQRKFLYAKFGPAWAAEHHFDNPGKLPQHVAKRKSLASKMRSAAHSEGAAHERATHSESSTHERKTG